MISYVAVFFIFLLLVHIVFNYNKKARTVRKIPGPKGSFITGNGSQLQVPRDTLFKLWRKWARRYKGIYSLHAFPISIVNIYNAEDIETITSSIKYHSKGVPYNVLKSWLGDGLLLSYGAKWQQRRKILTPAFHFNILKKYYLAIEENNKQLIEKLKKSDGHAMDIVPVISEYTLNAICETAMGIKLDRENAAGYAYKAALHNLGDIFIKRFTNIYYNFDFIYNLTPLKQKEDKLLSIAHNFTDEVIEKRRKMIKDKIVEDINSDLEKNDYKKKRSAMLDILLNAEKVGLIDREGIREEVDTFMFEGHDTTSGGLIYCLLALANEPFIQDKIIAEQRSIFDESDRNATMEDLASMRYLECCIKESLRLYPPVPFVARVLAEDVSLSSYKVPAHALCFIHIYDLHHNEDLYKNAEKFDPDRFLPENSTERHHYAYIPFSAGPRNCIGQKFAMMEMKSALSLIFRNFRLSPVTRVKDITFVADVVLRHIEPVYVKFIPK